MNNLNLEFESGVKTNIYLSYASRLPARFCEIVTDSETLRWDFVANNDMYLEEMKHFIDVCAGKVEPLITLTDGQKVLELIETAKINQ